MMPHKELLKGQKEGETADYIDVHGRGISHFFHGCWYHVQHGTTHQRTSGESHERKEHPFKNFRRENESKASHERNTAHEESKDDYP
jgi:hypothetical protein